MLRLYGRSDFKFNGTLAKNIRLKWIAICLNFNYVNGTVEMFLNGEKNQQIIKKPIVLPEESNENPLIVRFGKYFYDKTPLLGKVVDINIWDRYLDWDQHLIQLDISRILTEQEGIDFTNCLTYVPTPSGNLVNGTTKWNITGSLIKKISLTESEIFCSSRTLLIPVRYRTVHDAMAICEELGERGESG